MKLGLIVRSSSRGLGNLSYEWNAHLQPERVLVVVPAHMLPEHPENYPGATVVQWDHRADATLDEATVRGWLDGLDVVLSFETFYDWRVCDWAREQGVRTVCMTMPEYFRHDRLDLPAPDVWWTPTRWRLDQLPAGTRVVPVPIATERFPPPSEGGPLRWLHVGDHGAAADRNGTQLLLRALPLLREPQSIAIRSSQIRTRVRAPKHVTVTQPVAVENYWQLYENADALVLPRRYAGLSMPVLEAMGAGLAVVMSDVEPQRSEWPIIPVPTTLRGQVRTMAGMLPLAETNPVRLAAAMDRLASKPSEVLAAQHASLRYAQMQSWGNLAPMIRAELELACH